MVEGEKWVSGMRFWWKETSVWILYYVDLAAIQKLYYSNLKNLKFFGKERSGTLILTIRNQA